MLDVNGVISRGDATYFGISNKLISKKATNLRRDSLVEGGVRKEESGVRRVSMFLDFARITGQ
jgi:hypothetical protein